MALLYVHWLSLIGLFAASTARYSFVTSDDTDQHRLHLALGLNRLAGWLWLLAVVSGLTLALLSGQPPAVFLNNGLWLLKLVLTVLVPLWTLYPWQFLRQHAVVRSYGWVDVPIAVKVLLRLELATFLAIIAVALLLRFGISLDWR